jgi:tetratricopeptide (TPR) repeat protein
MRTPVAVLLSVACSLSAGDNWIREGNEAFYNLDYDQSIAAYEKAVAASPDDQILHNHVADALLYRGDKQRGLRTIEEVAVNGKANRVDARIVLCALYRREGRATRAIPLVSQPIRRYPRNYPLPFEMAQMYASPGNRRNALKTLGEIRRLKQENAPGYERVPWEKIYYEAGNLEFWFDDLDRALTRQGQIYDLQNHHNLAVKAYRQAVKFAPEAEAARESQHYINSPYTRPVRNQERG